MSSTASSLVHAMPQQGDGSSVMLSHELTQGGKPIATEVLVDCNCPCVVHVVDGGLCDPCDGANDVEPASRSSQSPGCLGCQGLGGGLL